MMRNAHNADVGAASPPRFSETTRRPVAAGTPLPPIPVLPPIPILVITLIAVGCGHKPEFQPADNRPPVKVQTIEVNLQRTPDIHEVVGTVRPRLAATIAPKVMATINQVLVAAGDTVTQGQLLAELDARELRAEFQKAKTDYDRYQALLDKQAATRAEFDAIESHFRVAEAALSDAAITAPFAGVVAQKSCDVGDMAAPGKPLFVVEQAGPFRLEADVPERFAGQLAVGKSAYVVVDATREKCEGTIAEIGPAADPATRSFLVKIDLACRQPLKSGMFGRAQLLIGERPALFVPPAAVHARGQLTYVFVAAAGKAQMRLVKTGPAYLDAVELLAGIEPGERVVVSAERELAEGQSLSQESSVISDQ